MNNSSVKLSTDDWELSAKEIADIIWLALHIEQANTESSITDNVTDNVSPLPISPAIERDKELETRNVSATTSKKEENSTRNTSEPRAGIYAQNQGESNSGLSLKVPDAVSIPEPLNLARKLKPLMRRIASGQQIVLDEEKTAEAIANNQGLWFPVFKPSLDLWLDLELVIDQSVSMLIWRQTIKELERLFKNYGVFRDVRIWGLTTNEKGEVQIHRGNSVSLQSQVSRSYKELVNSSGRSLILVVSDCVSPFWHSQKMTSILEHWTKYSFMAIIQMLPQWMWERTSLGWASEVQLKSLNLGTLNHNLITKAISTWDELEEGAKVPVFTLEPDMVEKWVQMLIGKSNIWNSGYLFPQDIDNFDNNELFQTGDNFTAENRVQIFRATASPVGRKLASLLAASPVITLPIVRLIQRSLLKESLQVNVAEVFLGGLLKPLSEIKPKTNPDTVQYDFMDGVRDLLLDHLPDSYVLYVVNEVSEYIADRIGLSLDHFIAVLKQEKKSDTDDNNLKYFATVTAQVLRRLGGEYEKFAQTLNNSWQNTTEDNKENDSKTFLYQHGNTKIYSFLTESPWDTSFDVLVIPAGYYGGIGRLGQSFIKSLSEENYNLFVSLINQEQEARTNNIITPESPLIITLTPEIYAQFFPSFINAKSNYFIILATLESLLKLSESEEIAPLIINTEKVIKIIIDLMQATNQKKLIIPLLGTGVNKLPVKDVATKMLSSIVKSLDDLSSNPIEEIIFVDNNEDNIKIINDVAQNLFNKNSQNNLNSISLKTFQFENVTVNSKGEIIKRENKQAQYFTEILVDDVFLDMVYIRSGKFIMGGSESEKSTKDEFPRHEVKIESFCIGKYLVTQAQWKVIANMIELKVSLDLNPEPSFFKGDNKPVDSISWYDAIEFCKRLSKFTGKIYRLPSEAEWEFACRAGTTTPFSFGDTITEELVNFNFMIEPPNETTIVGDFPPNAFGLYDMHGNLWEWCRDDWHNSYNNNPNDSTPWVDLFDIGSIEYEHKLSLGVLRGGSYSDSKKSCRSANRHSSQAKRANRRRVVGFRVVCEIKEEIIKYSDNSKKLERIILDEILSEDNNKYFRDIAFS
jgi:formylglycine-generating enzyme required for sulfatase activity